MKTFKKEERLCSIKSLGLLFKKGSSFLLYPYRVTYLTVEQASLFPAQIVINVPKKRYKHANDRNRVKRLCRESYRQHKEQLLYSQIVGNEQLLLLGIQYVGKQIYKFDFMDKRMQQMLKRLVEQLSAHENPQ